MRNYFTRVSKTKRGHAPLYSKHRLTCRTGKMIYACKVRKFSMFEYKGIIATAYRNSVPIFNRPVGTGPAFATIPHFVSKMPMGGWYDEDYSRILRMPPVAHIIPEPIFKEGQTIN